MVFGWVLEAFKSSINCFEISSTIPFTIWKDIYWYKILWRVANKYHDVKRVFTLLTTYCFLSRTIIHPFLLFYFVQLLLHFWMCLDLLVTYHVLVPKSLILDELHFRPFKCVKSRKTCAYFSRRRCKSERSISRFSCFWRQELEEPLKIRPWCYKCRDRFSNWSPHSC